jgi:hypothetical protein
MKTSRFATALDIGSMESINAHAAGFVSRMIVRRDGLCSARVSHPLHSRMLLEPDARLTSGWQFVTKVLTAVSTVHDHRRSSRREICDLCKMDYARTVSRQGCDGTLVGPRLVALP